MAFPIQAQILDFCVLAFISKNDTYGYELNLALMDNLQLSESTLYPVLRRLKKNKLLDTYDKSIDGRNRRYYTITDLGRETLEAYHYDWQEYKSRIDKLTGGVEID